MSDLAGSASRPFGRFERSLAWRYLRARREHGGASLISIISFVGIALAVAALIVTMSLMSGFRTTLVTSLIGGQGHVFILTGDVSQDEALAVADTVRGLDGISSVNPILEGQVLASANERQTGASVRGVRPQDLGIFPRLDEKDTEGFGEGRFGGNRVIVGSRLAARLGIGVGSRVTLISAASQATAFGPKLNNKDYVVAGTLKTGSVDLDTIYIFMPFEQAQLFFNERDRVQVLDVRLDDYRATDQAKKAIEEATGRRFFLDDWKRRNAQYLGALQTERGVMRIIMLVLITITSLNIITGVVMLVKNKTRDIAILRTIGAGRNAILRVFLMIGGTLGFTGALTGLALGTLMIVNIDGVEGFLNGVTGSEIFPAEVYGLEGLPAELNWGEALFTTAWAVAMSVLVTIFPARAAARMDPVDALRFE
ncbi:MAG: ABC transporter permease [Pseudomonadota bacterium]